MSKQIIIKAYGDEHDDVEFGYIELTDEAIAEIKQMAVDFSKWKVGNGALLSVQLYSPVSVKWLVDIEEELLSKTEHQKVEQGQPFEVEALTSEQLKDFASDFWTEQTMIEFYYNSDDFKFTARYKYTDGSVCTESINIADL